MLSSQRDTILIVEDEGFYLDVLVSMLRTEYTVLVARNGEEALQRLANGVIPDLILLDVLMPGIDGYETCKRLQNDQRVVDVPVIFLTARDEAEEEAHGLSLGAVDYIAKPINPAIVKARIQTHLALRRARHRLQLQNEELEKRVRERTATLQQLASEISLAEERERRRISAELHDGPAQRLALAKLRLGQLRESADLSCRDTLDQISESIGLAIRETRTLIVELSPPVLYELGLTPAVEWLADQLSEQHGIACSVDADDTLQRINQDLKVFLFQAVRELMINIVKHAQAKQVSVLIRSPAGKIRVTVHDDGIGFDTGTPNPRPGTSGGFGLFSLRERLDLYGGQIRIASYRGTTITLEVPEQLGGRVQL